MVTDLKLIDIRKLSLNPYDLREEKEGKDSEDFSELVQSIKLNGVLEPIIVRPVKGEKFEIIAGGRRYRASKLAGLKTIPAVVKDADDKAVKMWAWIENMQRKDMTDREKGQALQKIYKDNGMNIDDAIKGLNKLNNWNVLGYGQENPALAKIAKEVGISIPRQMQLLQIIKYIPSDVLQLTEKLKLDGQKRILLTKPKIRENPKLQRAVVNLIKDVPIQQARQIVHNIETGAYVFTGSGFKISGKSEKILDKPEYFSREAFVHFNKVSIITRNLMQQLTGQFKMSFDENDADRSNLTRFWLPDLKQLSERDLNIFYNTVSPLRETLDIVIELLEKEQEAREQKKELTKR